jgi:hypothetical protein
VVKKVCHFLLQMLPAPHLALCLLEGGTTPRQRGHLCHQRLAHLSNRFEHCLADLSDDVELTHLVFHLVKDLGDGEGIDWILD